MTNEEMSNNSSIKNFSLTSEYSDPLENTEEINKYRNSNINEDNKSINKDSITLEDNDSANKNLNSFKNKDSYPIPEDTNEVDVLKIYQEKLKINSQKEKEKDCKTYDFKKRNFSNDIDSVLNINSIINEEDNNNENLYSDKETSQRISHQRTNSEINILNIEENSIKKDPNLKNSNNNFHFDLNLEPLDTISEKKNDNKKGINKKFNKVLKKLKSLEKPKCNSHLISSIQIRKKTSLEIKDKIQKQNSKNVNHIIFDSKNILRTAVLMNSQKSKKKNILMYPLDTEIPNQLNSSINNHLPIDKVIINDIMIDVLDTSDLKNHLRVIDVTSNRKDEKKKFFKTLIELQNFYIDNSSVWVIKLSPDGKYLAGGCKSGKIKIYEVIGYNYTGFKSVYDSKNISDYLNFISQTPYRSLEEHKSDVIDLSWSPFSPNLLLSASLDYSVILWDISSEENNCFIRKFEHSDIVTSVCFHTFFKNVFVSGCLDTFIQIWKIDYFDSLNVNSENDINIFNPKKGLHKDKGKKGNKYSKEDKDYDIDKTNANLETPSQKIKDNIDYFNIQHKVTSMSFFPNGEKLAIGTDIGKIFVYNMIPRISYNHNFFVAKKKFGIFHGGKKVTNIQFVNKKYAIVTTADSRIRFVNMQKGTIKNEYKGYENKDSMIRSYYDPIDDVIIAGGEDGNCYVWKAFEFINGEKNKNYEYFRPFSKETIECSIIANEIGYTNYIQKILKLTNKILILNIIINGTSNGRLEILLNIKED